MEASHLRSDCFIPYPFSVPRDFMLDWFWFPIASLMLSLCLHQWHGLGLQPSATASLAEAGLCGEPPHSYQWPTGGPRGVIKQPPWPA